LVVVTIMAKSAGAVNVMSIINACYEEESIVNLISHTEFAGVA